MSGFPGAGYKVAPNQSCFEIPRALTPLFVSPNAALCHEKVAIRNFKVAPSAR